MDLESLYEDRFDGDERRRKDAVWVEICQYLRRFVPPTASVLDVGCDHGYFIRNIVAGDRWATDVRDMRRELPPEVTFIQSDVLALGRAVSRKFDRIFISNLLEHLDSGEEVVLVLKACRDLLAPGGKLMILQPNVKLVGHAYWDYLDHRVPLTEESLNEALRLAGLRIEQLIKRFLPYSTRSRLPQHPVFVRAYLKFPPLWFVFGKQTFVLAGRSARASSA